MAFDTGDNRILFIRIENDFIPIGCLTDNSFEESVELIDTTTTQNNGWKTAIPTNQAYSITFSGLQTDESGVYSYNRLKLLKRERELISWRIQAPTNPINIDYGVAYITSISETTPTAEFNTFTGSLTGYGAPLFIEDASIYLGTGEVDEIVEDGLNNLMLT